MRLHQVSELVHDDSAPFCRYLHAPYRVECLLCSFDGKIDILGCGLGYLAEHFAGCCSEGPGLVYAPWLDCHNFVIYYALGLMTLYTPAMTVQNNR